AQLWGDLGLLLLTQALPLPTLILLLCMGLSLGKSFLTLKSAIALNLLLLSIRFALLGAIFPAYYRDKQSAPASWFFWLSPLADPLAVLRIFLSTLQKPKQWRGRSYSQR
ncbi:MAG: glycosyltransferase family 2 protein, partial [Microcystaceae cyanobacterium]